MTTAVALACTVCGTPLSGASHNLSARPLCASQSCRNDRVRELRRTDPAYRAAERERDRQRRARRAETKATTARPYDGWAVCAGGCGRKFPAGSLLRGGCGGEWCPSGAGVAG